MSKQHNARISTLGSQATSIVSVSLVLLVLGMVALIAIVSQGVTADIRRNMGFVVEMRYQASEAQLEAFDQRLAKMPYVASHRYVSAEAILEQEGAAMGEDVMLILEQNPYSPEFDVKVHQQWANTDSLARIRAALLADSAVVADVVTHEVVIDRVNDNLDRIALVLSAVGVVLLIISFVLINNTVSLSIYSRRFLIHTMKLVGATAAFIRAPFMRAGLVSGLVASVIAGVVLALTAGYFKRTDPLVDQLLGWGQVAGVIAAMAIVGMALCSLAACMAVNRYLRARYDQLFRK